MTFLVLLLALALEKFSGWRRRIQRDGAWLAWLSLVEDLPSVSRRSWLGLLLAVVLPLLPLALLLTLLQPLAYGWLSLPLHLLVVVYSLGRGDVMADLGPFRDAGGARRPRLPSMSPNAIWGSWAAARAN